MSTTTTTTTVRPSIDERRRALQDRYGAWTPRTLDGFLDRCAAEFADRPFVLTDARTLTYAEVARQAERLGRGLVSLGVEPGDRVGLLMANHLEFVPLKFAVAGAGAVAIPFNFLYREAELAYVLAQSRCNVLVTMTSYGDLRYLEMLDRIVPGWERGAEVLGKRFPELRQVVALVTDDAPLRAGVLDVAGLEELGARADAPPAPGAASPDDLGDILYTSGTTGSPKGVMVTHDGVLRTGYASALTRAFEDGRRILFSLPCYHMFGYVEGILSAMYVGGAIIPRLRFSPGDYFAAIERHHATEMLAVPTMTVALLEDPARRSHDTSSLFAMLSGAAPAPVWLWEKVQAELGVSELTTGYGMTECGGAMTLTLPEDGVARHAGTVGRPKLAGSAGMPGAGVGSEAAAAIAPVCEYRTADPLTGELLPDGAEGELISRGPTHMLGYWDKPEQTGRALVGGWLHSGDLGLVDADGYVKVTGRSKELYKSGGELVMPKEIEDLLTRQPGISQAYAVGLLDDRWGEVGCVWVVYEPGSAADPEALLEVCRSQLARFKVPKLMLEIDSEALPRTPTGKVQKFRLIEMAGEVRRQQISAETR
jgi:fatty-acyl-CoA synthase